MRRFGHFAILLSSVAGPACISPVVAQDAPAAPRASAAAVTDADQAGVADIVVTATRMGETRLQSTPIAVTALTGAQLLERGVRDVQDLKNYVPSLQVSDLSGYTQLYIRGIGSNIVFIGSDPSTTIHSDGIYLARPLSYLSDFLDVERVEVLRGPQGTLYGRNSVGGTINVISRKPTEQLTGQVQALYGNYDRYGVAGYVSGPVAGGVRASLAADISGHDAFRKNISTGNDLEDLKSRGVRGQLLVPVAATGEWIVRGDWSRQSGALGVYPKLLLPGPTPTDTAALGTWNHVSMDDVNHTVLENYGVASDLTLPLADSLKLRSLTGYRWFRGSIVADADSSAAPILLNQIRPIRQHQLSQELSLLGDNGPFHWVLGGYYFYEHNKEPLTLSIFANGITHIQRPLLEARSLAGFAQGEYALTDTISVIAGLRYTKEKKSYEISDYYTLSGSRDPDVAEAAFVLPGTAFAVDTHRRDHALTPKFGINWKPEERVLVYASATRGFKSGGFDYGSNNPIDAAAGYGPEKLWSYEVGLKSDLLDRRLRFNLTGFYYDYTDLQVQNYVQNIVTGSFGAVTQNAATARVKGIETEIVARPFGALELSANVAYLDAKYRNYPSAFVGPFGNFDASGNRLNNAPKWSATFGANYMIDLAGSGTINLGADAHVQSRVFFTAANGAPFLLPGTTTTVGYPEQQKSYDVVNGRVGWTSPDKHWKAQVVGSNLFNKHYVLGTANFGLGNISARQGRPREVFGQVSYTF